MSSATLSERAWPYVAIPVGMLMLSFAAVPLYDLFCRVTGFGGTTQVAAHAPGAVAAAAPITVTMNTDIDPALPWAFKPLERHITLPIGEQRLSAFVVENLADHPTRGHAVYNVTPNAAGKYFNKIQCFCFEEQKIGAKAKVNMPVSFFIDPAILEDKDLHDLRNITLSYTFFSYESRNK
ncbi:MAG: cytochrome c oxidase assembly protein [Rickettsiales bacterium]|jgi:cytochrome c oxidase assembly protein subunit 11|nr:cytochrome c oxidase assembly protein [Rickettsiales bacterium]